MSGWTLVPEPQPQSGWTPVQESKPFSVVKAAGQTAEKLAKSAVDPRFLPGQSNSQPNWSDYQWGLAQNLDRYGSPTEPAHEAPSGLKGWLSKHLPQPRTDFTPKNPQEQSEYNEVLKTLNSNPKIGESIAEGISNFAPILDKARREIDPTDAASTTAANLIMLRQGFKQLPGNAELPAPARTALTATGNAVESAAPYIGKGAKEAARFGGATEFFRTGNPVALAGAAVAPLAEKAAAGATSWLGRFLKRAGSVTDDGALTPEQEAIYNKAIADKQALPAIEPPKQTPEFASDEEIMDRVLNPDNGVRLPSATSLPSRQLPRGAIELPASDLPVSGTAPPVAATTRAQRLGLLLPEKAGSPIALGQGEGVPLTPAQQATLSAAESKAQAVPAGEPQSSQPSTIPRVASGEGVLNKALTSLDNKNLLKIAKSRGIDVTREAQLKPGAANGTLIKKIIDDFSPDELDEIRNMGMEISRNLPVQNPNVTPEAAAEAWHYKVLNQFFPDVSIPKTMAARAQATIANRPLSAGEYMKARFEDAKAAQTQQPPTTDWSLENMAKQIRLNQAKRSSASAGND